MHFCNIRYFSMNEKLPSIISYDIYSVFSADQLHSHNDGDDNAHRHEQKAAGIPQFRKQRPGEYGEQIIGHMSGDARLERAEMLVESRQHHAQNKCVDPLSEIAVGDTEGCGTEDHGRIEAQIIPQSPEQGAVAKRTEELGAGVMLKSISEEDILQALTRVLTVPSYKDNAVKISESFRRCGGAKEARAFLEEAAAK